MRAVVFATGPASLHALTEAIPAPMLPLLDRPFLQHVLEFLIDLGVQSFDFILSEHPAEVERHFETGKRWGCEIRYHLARDAASPFGVLQAVPPASEPLFLVDGARLPMLRKEEIAGPGVAVEGAAWAVIPGELLPGLASAADWSAAEAAIRQAVPRSVESAMVLSLADYSSYLEANRLVLEGRFPIPLLTAREVQPGIWISRNVSLHPSAKLEAPVFVGENCRIGEAAQIGPLAVLGRDCVLDRQSMVRESVVLPGSYVGEALDLENAIVDRGKLINITLGAELAIGEEFLLGSVTGRGGARGRRLLGRMFAAMLLAVFSPVLLLVWLAHAFSVHRRDVLSLPAPSDPDRWQTVSLASFAAAEPRSALAHFLRTLLPGLWAVVRGRLCLVGVPPQTPGEVQALPADWRAMYLRSRAGLITEAFVEHGAAASADDRYACDAFYAVSAGARLDASILLRYTARLCGFGALKPKSRPTAAGGES
jgi:hypothetical protein